MKTNFTPNLQRDMYVGWDSNSTYSPPPKKNLNLKNIDKLIGHSTLGWNCVSAREYDANTYVISWENHRYPNTHCVFYLGKEPISADTYPMGGEAIKSRNAIHKDMFMVDKNDIRSFSEFMIYIQKPLAGFEKIIELSMFKSRLNPTRVQTITTNPTPTLSPQIISAVTKRINGGQPKSILDRIKDVWNNL